MKKKITPVIIITLVLLFMLFIYEPITFFASSTDDYWFGLDILIKSNIIYIIYFLVFLLSIGQIIILISNKIKNEKVYMIYLLLFNVFFVFLYIQGNFLSYNLPLLNGSPIKWGSYTGQMIISVIAFLIILAINIYLFIKYKEKYKRITINISCVVFVMLLTSLITTMVTNKQIYSPKGKNVLSFDNINNISTDKNFLIFLSDMTDSKTFSKVLKNNNKEYLLKDFTYYPDTLSMYPFTKESIPYILTGNWYDGEVDFVDYYNKSMNESKFLNKLKEQNYSINLYEDNLLWNEENRKIVDNNLVVEYEVDSMCFLIEELKYLKFKYLPFPLKETSNIESLNYGSCRHFHKSLDYSSDNKKVYDHLDKLNKQNDNYFQFLHIFGGHYPWTENKNFEHIENGTYEDKLEEALTVLEKYIVRLKESGQYDNSVIIIMADHGCNGYEDVGLQNPILYIKGINEVHDEMIVSNKKISYEDLNDSIFFDLLDGKQSTDLMPNVSEDRVRRFIWYGQKSQYIEQTLDGHAWETEKLKNTGKSYKKM